MTKYICSVFVVSVLYLFASEGRCGTETIIPEDTLSIENTWFTNSLGGKVSSVTDGIDGFYIYDNAAGGIQRFTLTDESTIPTDATIDSFVVLLRAQKTTGGTTRIRNRIRMDGNTNYCDGSNISLTTSWVNYSEKFTLTPTGGASCTGSLTKDRIDSLGIQILGIMVPGGGEARVTDIDVIIYYTESGGASLRDRRRRLILISNIEDNGYENMLSPLPGKGNTVIGSVDIVFASSIEWIWHSK